MSEFQISKRWICHDNQGACAPEFFCFRHPRWAEDAHGAFHWWCLRQCAAFRLPANGWCRPFQCPVQLILRFKCASISGLSSDIIGSTSLHFWCISACCSVSGTPLKEFAFRPLFPHERCEEDPWVDRIGWATLICYGVFIPCFLGFLFAKQNVVMRQVKTAVMHTTCDEGTVKVWLQGLETKQSFKDRTCAKSVDVCRFRETGLLAKPCQATSTSDISV